MCLSVVLRDIEVVEDGSGGCCACGLVVDAEAFETLGAEMLEETFEGGLGLECPVVEGVCGPLGAEGIDECLSVPFLEEDFFGAECGEESVGIVGVTLAHEEFAGGYVEEGYADVGRGEVDAAEEVVFACHEDTVGHCDARRDEFCYATSDNAFGCFRVFKLVANGYS